MTTRYSEILIYAFQYSIFCFLIIGIYYILNQRLKNIVFEFVNGRYLKIYMQDILLCLILVFVVGFRCNNGSDYYNYLTMYSEVRNWDSSIESIFEDKFQNGYILLCYLTKFLGGKEYSIFWVVSVIIYFPTIYIFRKYTQSPVISFACWVLFGYLAMSTNILKQSLAMTCILYAFYCLENGRYLFFACLSLLGCMFHISMTYVIIIMLFCRKIKPTISLFKKITLLSVVVFFLIKPLLNSISKYLPEHYVIYIQMYLDGNVNELKLQIGGIIVAIFYFILLWSITKKYNSYSFTQSRVDKHLLTISLFSIPFLLFGIKFYLSNRVAYSCLQFLILLIPSCYNFTRSKYIIDLSKYIFVFVFNFLFTIFCAENNYYQYSTIFNDKPMSVYDFSIQKQQ